MVSNEEKAGASKEAAVTQKQIDNTHLCLHRGRFHAAVYAKFAKIYRHAQMKRGRRVGYPYLFVTANLYYSDHAKARCGVQH
jgi:hypothetical protein